MSIDTQPDELGGPIPSVSAYDFGRLVERVRSMEKIIAAMQAAQQADAANMTKKVDALIVTAERARGGFYVAVFAASALSAIVSSVVAAMINGAL